MAHLVKIGNSQGIFFPKPLIQQAQLEGKELGSIGSDLIDPIH